MKFMLLIALTVGVSSVDLSATKLFCYSSVLLMPSVQEIHFVVRTDHKTSHYKCTDMCNTKANSMLHCPSVISHTIIT